MNFERVGIVSDAVFPVFFISFFGVISFFFIFVYSFLSVPFFLAIPFLAFYFLKGRGLSILLITIALFVSFKNFFLLVSYSVLGDEFQLSTVPVLLSVDYTLFIVTSVVFLLFYIKSFNLVKCFFCLLVLFYIVVGMVFSSPLSVATYSRFYLVPMLTLFMVAYGRPWLKDINMLLYGLIGLYLCYLFCEAFIPGFYEFIDIQNYAHIKYWKDPSKAMSDGDLVGSLGTSIAGYRITRLLGPQFHPISVGYMILFICCFLYAEKRLLFYFLFPFLLAGMLFSSKGAFVASLCLFVIFFLRKIKLASGFIPLVFALYAISMFAISSIPGLSSGYEHLAGFLGAMSNFTNRPLGLGVGSGGTMSSFGGAQFGGESGFGAVLAHLGIVGVFLYGGVIFALVRAVKIYGAGKLYIYASYLVVVLINGLLQEEALLPSASFLGWLMFSFYATPYLLRDLPCFSKVLSR